MTSTTTAASLGAGLPHVDIVLVNWNGCADLLECLASVFRQDYPRFRVLVCDNASQDGSLDKVERWVAGDLAVRPASAHFAALFDASPLRRPASVRYTRAQAEAVQPGQSDPALVLIDTGGNLGFAGGNNVGLRYALAQGDAGYVWVLNTDTIVDPQALRHLVARAQRDGAAKAASVGVVGSTLIHYWEPSTIQAAGGATFDPATCIARHLGVGQLVSAPAGDPAQIEAQTAYVVGASMLVSVPFLQQVGLMCEDYFLYFEELDWAVRAQGRFTLAYSPASLVYHKVGGSSSKVASVGSMGYLYRSRLKFVARHYPQRYQRTVLVMVGEIARHLLKGRYKQAKVVWQTLRKSGELRSQGRARAGHVWQ